jgi:hypothetical protein
MAKKVTISGVSEKPQPFKVRATQVGFYDNARRRVGDVFIIQSVQEFSTRWMQRVPDSTPERITGPNAAIREAHDAILGGSVARSSVLSDDGGAEDENPLGA